MLVAFVALLVLVFTVTGSEPITPKASGASGETACPPKASGSPKPSITILNSGTDRTSPLRPPKKSIGRTSRVL